MAVHIIYRIGSLGDTLVALPSIYALKEAFPQDEFVLLCNHAPGSRRVLAHEVIKGTSLFEKVLSYPLDESFGSFQRTLTALRLWFQLKGAGAKRLSYLAPSIRTPRQVKRDKQFFKSAGITEIYGMKGFFELPVKKPGQPLEAVQQEADLLLERLAQDGIKIPLAGQGGVDLLLGTSEEKELEKWLATQKTDGGRRWLGVGPFAKQSVNLWPVDRYVEVVKRLIEKHDLWPVVLGSAPEAPWAEALLKTWGRGYNAAGALAVRGSAMALSRCTFYLGADSGPIHLAAAVKTPCVGIYSAHGWPGRWSPYGEGHRVIRRHPECEGCGLVECVEKKMECVTDIQVSEVLEACEQIMEKVNAK